MPLETLQNGRYRILRTIGSGSMGEVYLVDDTRINRQVAIKVIRLETISADPEDSSGTIDAARLFEREAKSIARLNHPNILPLYDFGEEAVNGNPLTYMVMPYSPEGSLATWLQQRNTTSPLSPQDIEHFLRQAADALQHAHDNDLIHQDVKPQNFLVRTNKKARLPDLMLADFGIAKLAVGTSGASQAIRGTPIYMAPEQWEGNPVPASDQYALAVMIYQLMAGRLPFQGGPGQMMYQHFNVAPQPPSTFNTAISPALDAVILRAMAKKPEDRYPSVSAFANAFQQALTGEAPPVSPTQHKLGGESIRATLAISSEEARSGTNRTLTLAGGQRVRVIIPPGMQSGQVLRAAVQDRSSTDSSATIPLLLTIAVAPGENLPTVLTNNEETFATGLPTIGPGSDKIPGRNMATALPDGGKTTLGNQPTILNSSHTPTPIPPYYDTPSSSMNSMSPPPPGIPPTPPRPRRGRIILLIVLAFVLIVVSAGALFDYFAAANSNTANATATAQANSNTATSQSNSTGTAQANATATTQANATATATVRSKGNADATATANAQTNANATATAVTLGNINANNTATAQASASVVPFTVQSVTMAVNPTSIAGDACGTTITVTYTATFVVSASSSGGTVQFAYTVNGGHSQTNASLTFAAGVTTNTYSFTWTGALPADHTYPGIGEVTTSSPNAITSKGIQPGGECVSVTPTPT